MDLLNLCKQLIGIRSCSETHGTTEIVRHLMPVLQGMGGHIQTQEVQVAGRTNLNMLATFGDTEDASDALLLNTHLDTVATGALELWTQCHGDPFAASLHDGYLYGLGTADTKLAMACVLIALDGVLRNRPQQERRRFSRPLKIMASAGEELGLIGAKHALETGFARGRYALISEPSELNLVWAHKGLCACIIEMREPSKIATAEKLRYTKKEFFGEAAHSSTPHLGVNALEKALTSLADLPDSQITAGALFGGSAPNIIPAHAELFLQVPQSELKPSETLSTPPYLVTANVFRAALKLRAKLQTKNIELAGEPVNDFSPPQATTSLTLAYGRDASLFLLYDHRFIHPGDGERFAALLQQLVAETAVEFPQLQLQCHVERLNHPMFGDKDGYLLKEMQAIQKQVGLPGLLKTKAGCTEGALFAKHGMEAIVVGPGRAENNIHKPNEKVSFAQLEQAVKMYEAVIERLCL